MLYIPRPTSLVILHHGAVISQAKPQWEPESQACCIARHRKTTLQDFRGSFLGQDCYSSPVSERQCKGSCRYRKTFFALRDLGVRGSNHFAYCNGIAIWATKAYTHETPHSAWVKYCMPDSSALCIRHISCHPAKGSSICNLVHHYCTLHVTSTRNANHKFKSGFATYFCNRGNLS